MEVILAKNSTILEKILSFNIKADDRKIKSILTRVVNDHDGKVKDIVVLSEYEDLKKLAVPKNKTLFSTQGPLGEDTFVKITTRMTKLFVDQTPLADKYRKALYPIRSTWSSSIMKVLNDSVIEPAITEALGPMTPADVWDFTYMTNYASACSSNEMDYVFELVEAGCFGIFFKDDILYALPMPTNVCYTDGRLHNPNGAIMRWLNEDHGYFVNGTKVPMEWITDKKSVKLSTVMTQSNLEIRRAGIEIFGWAAILKELKAVVVDEDGDPLIGTLLEVKLPDVREPQRFCKVLCGTGREFAICVPNTTKTAMEAQAWMKGLSLKEFKKPEIRT